LSKRRGVPKIGGAYARRRVWKKETLKGNPRFEKGKNLGRMGDCPTLKW